MKNEKSKNKLSRWRVEMKVKRAKWEQAGVPAAAGLV